MARELLRLELMAHPAPAAAVNTVFLLVRSFLLLAVPLALACGGGDDPPADPFVIGPAGGTVSFDNGVVIEIPPGAVTSDTRFGATLLDADETDALLAETGMHPRLFLAGAELAPDGASFATKVRVTMPIARLPETRGLPFHFVYDPHYHAYYPNPTELSLDPEAGTVTVATSHFSPNVIAEIQGVLRDLCEERDCPCAAPLVVEATRNFEISDAAMDCTAAEIRGTAVYPPGCEETTMDWLFVEHSEGCAPRLTLTPQTANLARGATQRFDLDLTYTGEPYAAAELATRSTSPGVASTSTDSVVTSPAGSADFDVLGVSDGVSTIIAEGAVRYRPLEITISGVVQQLEEKTKTVRDRSAVTVGATPVLELSIRPTDGGASLHPGGSAVIDVAIRVLGADGERTYLPNVTVALDASAGHLAESSVRTREGGATRLGFTAPDEAGLVTIGASATVTTLSPTAEEMTHELSQSATIEVRERGTEAWTGTLSIDYGLDEGVPGAAQLSGSVYASFILAYDPDASPAATLTSSGAEVNGTLDGVDGEPTMSGSCEVYEFWSDITADPFDVEVSAAPVPSVTGGLSAHLAFRSVDPLTPMASAQRNEHLVCDGEDFSLGTETFEWNPAVAAVGDPNWGSVCLSGASACIVIDASDPGPSTVSGNCDITGANACTYTLTLTRP